MDANLEEVLDKCLAAFVAAGTLDVSLDKLAGVAGVSKRMLIHYFGGKEAIEELATTRLEDRLRAQFRADTFPAGTPLAKVIGALWEQSTNPKARGILLLVMDLNRRAWGGGGTGAGIGPGIGSDRARAFYMEQQRLWVELLQEFCPDRVLVESVLQLFQGAVLTFLITGDRERGRSTLERFLATQ
jgi:AcrR family transcriptional regulator